MRIKRIRIRMVGTSLKRAMMALMFSAWAFQQYERSSRGVTLPKMSNSINVSSLQAVSARAPKRHSTSQLTERAGQHRSGIGGVVRTAPTLPERCRECRTCCRPRRPSVRRLCAQERRVSPPIRKRKKEKRKRKRSNGSRAHHPWEPESGRTERGGF